jgi:hypothetical protein
MSGETEQRDVDPLPGTVLSRMLPQTACVIENALPVGIQPTKGSKISILV